MYLSKVSFQASQQARQLLLGFGGKGVYSTHQMLWQLFTEEDERSFLFREEQSADGSKAFFVLSSVKPESDESTFNVKTKTFMPKLQSGQRLGFTLRANPTVCTTDEKGKSKRHDVMMHAKKAAKESGVSDSEEIRLIMEQAAQEWIANPKRLENWGFTLDFLPEVQTYMQHRSDKNREDKIRFSSVDYQGVLTVQDPEKFLEQLEKGFGRAKSLGCGLMLIKSI
jgi:CRISPR system Cascade subunit CasE|uniref:CRISPR-associated protein, Cse3 family n=1 Tax=Marinomonas sp. (strain MWYL1) TaxID=400668 RepID=A6W167_MARMS